ncbi:MAG: GNAT family N-acetyltransferase [Candidatus Hodarchaeota archaeon]
MSELHQVQRLREDQVEIASKVLAQAFQDDPLFVYLYPDPIKRKIGSVIHCEFLILTGILYMEGYITSNDIEGIALWRAYNIKDHKIEIESKEIKRRVRKVKKENFSDPLFVERYGIFTEVQSYFENKYANFPHWELMIIGVDPIHQGKGYGSKLLRMKLVEIDKQNLSCYLHTENERNVGFYEHFGFELIDKKKVPNADFYFHAMLRK